MVRLHKQFFALILVAGLACSVLASRMDEVTLVMLPREDNVVRIGKDLASRYPTLLISYQVGPNGAVSLHGWTGTEWLNVTPESYKDGTFFHNGPTDAILVEPAGQPIADSLIPSELWCPSVHKISTDDTRTLLHLIGQHYGFKYKDWKWFATSYKLDIDAINPEGLNVSWYNKSLADHFRKGPAVDGSMDLQYWSVIREPGQTLGTMAPETIEEEPVVEPETTLEESSTNSVEQVEEAPTEDVLTNAAPEAVVLGAGDAEAAVSDEPSTNENTTAETTTEQE